MEVTMDMDERLLAEDTVTSKTTYLKIPSLGINCGSSKEGRMSGRIGVLPIE